MTSLLSCALVLLAVGCTPVGRSGSSASSPASSYPSTSSTPAGATLLATGTPAGTGAPAPPPRDSGYRVVYGWAAPTGPVHIDHRLRVPIAPPPALPLPALVRIDAGDHPADGFSRLSFAFRGALPGYEVAYVPRVEADGSGNPIRLSGNAFLRVRFDQAQAHGADGRTTVLSSPGPEIGFPTLRGYGAAGDFEGVVSYGIGVQVTAGSDQVLPIRLGESTRADGSFVVSIDVRRG